MIPLNGPILACDSGVSSEFKNVLGPRLRSRAQKRSSKVMPRTVLVQSADQVAIHLMERRPDYAAQAASATAKGERVRQTALNPSVQETQDLPQGELSARLDPPRVLSCNP